jgi:ElaB/YqjD/DUF883 family membrane-anchored ribosome-binding protein
MNAFVKSSSEKLIDEIKSVVADAEAILRATKGQAGAEVAELHSTMSNRLAAAKSHLMSVETAVVDRTRMAAKQTDAYIHNNPWQSILFVGGLGLLIGFLMPGRRD